MFVRQFISANNKEAKTLLYWAFVLRIRQCNRWIFRNYRMILRSKGQLCWKCAHVMMSSCFIPARRTHDAIITSLLRQNDVIMTLLLRRVSTGGHVDSKDQLLYNLFANSYRLTWTVQRSPPSDDVNIYTSWPQYEYWTAWRKWDLLRLPQPAERDEWTCTLLVFHDDLIKWKHFPRNWPFVRGIQRSPVNSPHERQWRGALVFSLICAWRNGWVNDR